MSDLQLHAKWEDVAGGFDKEDIALEKTLSDYLFKNPKKILQILSVYKFVAKMCGPSKSILQLGLNQAIGPLVFEKENMEYVGLSQKNLRLKTIKENWKGLELKEQSLQDYSKSHDALFFDCFASDESYLSDFLNDPTSGLKKLNSKGLLFMGFENKDKCLQAKESVKSHFRFQFVFSVFGENIQPGAEEYADYFLVMNCL